MTRMRPDDPAASVRWPGIRILKTGFLIGLGGTAPLLLYIVLGPKDGNPIGLGLMAGLAVPLSGIVMGFGLVKLLVKRFFSNDA